LQKEKKAYDKRQTIKQNDWQRDKERALKNQN
jgi:tmRNA-binding protein